MQKRITLGVVIILMGSLAVQKVQAAEKPTTAEKFLKGFLGTQSEKDPSTRQCRAEKQKMLRGIREDLHRMLSKVERSLDTLY